VQQPLQPLQPPLQQPHQQQYGLPVLASTAALA
jgi:hypothetical protein